MMFVEGRVKKDIYADYKYYGTCIDEQGKKWSWYSSCDSQVMKFKKQPLFGMTLLTFSGNKSFYIAQRFKNLLPKNDTKNN